MAELVDALVSGTSGSNTLEVRVFLCPPYVKDEGFWGCSSVGRALRSQCRGREFESHQLHHEFSLSRAKRTIKKIQCCGFVFDKDGQCVKKSWGYGGMVDAEDLKSFDHCDRVGSSPTIPTTNFCYCARNAHN